LLAEGCCGGLFTIVLIYRLGLLAEGCCGGL